MSARKGRAATGAEHGSTPGVHARSQLLDAHVRRHHAKYRLLYTYSHKRRREVVLLGRASYELFLFLESRPDQKVVEHLHLEVPNRTGKGVALRQVIVTERQAAYTVHVVCSNDEAPNEEAILDAARLKMALGIRVQVTLQTHARSELLERDTLIVNWQRLNGYLSAASTFSLQSHCQEILSGLKAGGVRVVGDLMPPDMPGESFALRIAALAELIQAGRVISDLDARPFGARSTLGMVK